MCPEIMASGLPGDLLVHPEDNLGPDLAGWCASAAEYIPRMKAEEPLVGQGLYTFSKIGNLLRPGCEST